MKLSYELTREGANEKFDGETNGAFLVMRDDELGATRCVINMDGLDNDGVIHIIQGVFKTLSVLSKENKAIGAIIGAFAYKYIPRLPLNERMKIDHIFKKKQRDD